MAYGLKACSCHPLNIYKKIINDVALLLCKRTRENDFWLDLQKQV